MLAPLSHLQGTLSTRKPAWERGDSPELHTMNNPATIPNICRTPKGLPTVKWCLEVLEWAGWQHEFTEPAYDDDTGHTHRVYFLIDPNGKQHGLTAGGLRYEAEIVWVQAQVCAESLLTTRTP